MTTNNEDGKMQAIFVYVLDSWCQGIDLNLLLLQKKTSVNYH
jgi:hypothetical protein